MVADRFVVRDVRLVIRIGVPARRAGVHPNIGGKLNGIRTGTVDEGVPHQFRLHADRSAHVTAGLGSGMGLKHGRRRGNLGHRFTSLGWKLLRRIVEPRIWSFTYKKGWPGHSSATKSQATSPAGC